MEMHFSYGKQELDDKYCFLCGDYLFDESSVEHVFPKWLLRKYDLWHQKIDLLNRSSIPYRQLTIPCCEKCNNEHLSRVENEVSRNIKRGFEGAKDVPENTWYLWVAKIFYGVLRKEVSLAIDRSDSKKGNILPDDVLTSFNNLHLFLQAFRGKHSFIGDVPYTVLLCNLHDIGDGFDFRDNLINSIVAIRMGDIGIIVSLEDGGLVKNTYGEYVSEVDNRKLHPIQFIELYAKICYQVNLLKTRLNYVTDYHVHGEHIATTHLVDSPKYIGKWNQEEFANLLNFNISQWLLDGWQVEYSPPDKVSTWMYDSEGKIKILPIEEWQPAKGTKGATH